MTAMPLEFTLEGGGEDGQAANVPIGINQHLVGEVLDFLEQE